MSRLEDVQYFYELLDTLERKNGGAITLADCSGNMNWPKRGVYFFQELGEERTDTGSGPRIVRVGTHALKRGARSTLWTRLRQHKGTKNGGNHRGSIFRLIIGQSIIERQGGQDYGAAYRSWGKGSTASRETREREADLERRVNEQIQTMPFHWLGLEDEPGPDSLRGYIERNSIALLSNFDKSLIDPPSEKWLGRFCDRDPVRKSGLWNSNHVQEQYDQCYLQALEKAVDSHDG